MKEINQLLFTGEQTEDQITINDAIQAINSNFTLLADTLEQHRLCLVSMNDVIEPTSEFLEIAKKELEALKLITMLLTTITLDLQLSKKVVKSQYMKYNNLKKNHKLTLMHLFNKK